MATGVKIQSAKYGVGSTTLDVKNAVSAQLTDGKLNFLVTPAILNVDDPAPGQIKTLTVTYTINNGASNVATAVDGEPMQIDAPPARLASGLQIKKAQYGYDGNYANVTSAVRTYLKNGSINMTVSPKTVGIPDPNPQKPKFLKVDYTINGQPGSKSIPDGQAFVLNAPAVKSDTTRTPTDGVFSIIGMITTDLWYFVMMFFVFSMTIQSMKYADLHFYRGTKWLVGGLTLFTYGLFPLIALPIWLFWWTLIFG